MGLTTNGATPSTEVGKRLLAFSLHQIDVSIQTPDPDFFRLRKSKVLSFDAYVRGVLRFFQAYKAAWPETIFRFRFLNTRFRNKGIEQKVGPVEVISSTESLRATFSAWANKIYDILESDQDMRKKALARIENLVAYKWNVAEIFPHVHFET